MIESSIFLFTNEYPYGLNSETFLESEIVYLSKEFDHIYIFPYKSLSKDHRSIPANVVIIDLNLSRFLSKALRLKILIKYFFKVVYIYFYMLFSKKNFFNYLVHFKFYINYLTESLYIGREVSKWLLRRSFQKPIFYSYWFDRFPLSFCQIDKKFSPIFVSRIHGYDLYDERWGMYLVPFRDFKVHLLDSIFTVSITGSDYLKTIVTQKYHYKIYTNFLGVPEYEKSNCNIKNNDHFTIVSCSSLIPLKQVDKIVKSLCHTKSNIEYFHFGDGYLRNDIVNICAKLPKNVHAEIVGFVPNSEIIKFYQNNEVDLFITLSTSEGIPVSIMEAISFGIPILATNVGGIPEIVTKETGVLVNVDEGTPIIAEKIEELLHNPMDKNTIIDFFHEHFEASSNYSNFITRLKNIKG